MKRLFGVICAAALCGCAFFAWGGNRAAADGAPEKNLPAPPSFGASAPAPAETVLSENGVFSPETAEKPAFAEAPAQEAQSGGEVLGEEGDYLSPLVTLRADPYLYKYEGVYYFTGSYPLYDRIELTSADSVNGIAAAVPKTIWKAPSGTQHVWAPEIHHIMGEWVIYYAASENGAWDIKCYALRCTGDDPMHDPWEYMGKIKAAEKDTFSNNSGMSLDMTVFETGGKWYAIWAQKPTSSNLYIAEMKTPFELATKSVLITQPDYDWEKGGGEHVNEGPAVLKHADKIFVSFSAARTDSNYCMGLLEMDACDDPLLKESWKKYPEPVFQTDASLKIYGPGHNCFVEGDYGEQLCVLHFRDYKDISGDSLYDYNRHAHVMKITYDRNGIPQFHFDPDDVYNAPYNNHR